MSVIAFCSAKGAPGATTTAMLVSSLWPRPAVLADCDPAGGDIALRLPAPDGRPLDLSRGMLSLLPLARRSLEPSALAEHTQHVLGGGEVIAGLAGPEQAAAAGPVWGALADLFAALPGRDVVLDLGRLDSRSAVLPLAMAADVLVCVTQASLAGVYATRSRLRTLLPEIAGREGRALEVGLVVRGPDAREAQSAGGVIQGEFPDVRFFGQVAEDATGARMFDGQHVSRPERTLLVRSGADLVATLDGTVYVAGWQSAPESAPVPAWTATPAAATPGGPDVRLSRAAERALRKGGHRRREAGWRP